MECRRWVALASCALLLAAGCESKTAKAGGEGAGTAADDIPIGAVIALSGSYAPFGLSTQKGILLAIEQLNAAGGVHGRRFRLVTIDDQSDPERAVAAFEQLAKDKVALVIGEHSTAASLAMAAVADRERIPMITPTATNPRVTEGRQYVFRVCFTDTFQGLAMARFVRQHLKLSRVAILRGQLSYAVDLGRAFEQGFQALGGRVVKDLSYPAGESDFRPQLEAIRKAGVEAIYLPAYYGDVGLVAQQAQALGISLPLLGGDGWLGGELSKIGGQAVEGSYYSNHYSTQDPSPRTQRFVQEYRATYREEPDSNAALAYDAMRVAAHAIARARSLQGPALRDAIAHTRDFEGATGTITIDAHHNATKPAVILRIEGGRSLYQAAIVPEPAPL